MNLVVAPDDEHVIHHLIVARVLDTGKSPDATFRHPADSVFEVGGGGVVLDPPSEVRRRGLEDLL